MLLYHHFKHIVIIKTLWLESLFLRMQPVYI